MDAKIKPFFERADLSQYSFRERLTIRFVAAVFGFFIKTLGRTIRFEIEGQEHLDAIREGNNAPILTIWHENIFLSTYFLRGLRLVVITSQSLDGEYIARCVTKFGFGTVRGSSTRGGSDALVKMVRLARDGVRTAFTIDGPRGPRRVAKPGACSLAMKSGGLIYPLSVEPEKFWTVKSWDRLKIPKPFSRAVAVFESPIAVVSDASADEFDARLAELQSKLDAISEFGEKWRQSSS